MFKRVQKLTKNQLNLAHGTKNGNIKKIKKPGCWKETTGG